MKGQDNILPHKRSNLEVEKDSSAPNKKKRAIAPKKLDDDEDITQTILDYVTNFKEQEVSKTEFENLFSNAQIKICNKEEDFIVADDPLPNQKELTNYTNQFKNFINLTIVNDTHGNEKENTTENEKLNLYSDWNFSICDETVISKLDFCPYFGAYELKKNPIQPQQINSIAISSISNHIDFCKMVCVLRGMMKNYSTLGMNVSELEKIRVWGVLQRVTQIWFLQCKVEMINDATDVNCFTILYTITYSNDLDIIRDNQKVYKLFCNMFNDAAILIDVLKNFTPTKVKIRDNDQRTLTNNSAAFSFELEEDIICWYYTCAMERFSAIDKCSTLNGTLNLSMRTTLDLFFARNELYFSNEKVLEDNYVLSYIGTFLKPFVYFYVSSNKFVRNVETFAADKLVLVFFRIDERKFLVLQYSSLNQLEKIQLNKTLNHADEYNEEKADKACDDSIMFTETMDVANLDNAQQQLKAAHHLYLNKIKPSYSVFCNFSICDRNIYCNIVRKHNTPANFLKYAHTSKSSEAIVIMQKLANQELHHKNINKIEHYSVIKKYNKQITNDYGWIAITECEGLQHIDTALEDMKMNSVSCLVDWILKSVILDSLSGLEYLHSNGIIHGDLSFGNIMFKRSHSSGDEKINYYYYAVLCDLNECFLMEDKASIANRRFAFGKEDYLMSVDCIASVECDCFAWMICICKLIYFILFRKRDNSSITNHHKELTVIFEVENWNRLYTNDIPTILCQTLTQWKRIFEHVIFKKYRVTRTILQQLFHNAETHLFI